jgi:hypothetical protein
MVDRMLIAGCYGSSIAEKMSMHPDTLYIRCELEKGMGFTAYAQKKLEVGNDILRQVQFSKACKGDNPMLIWLGKNRMGQTDKIEQKVKADVEVSQKSVLELPDDGMQKND